MKKKNLYRKQKSIHTKGILKSGIQQFSNFDQTEEKSEHSLNRLQSQHGLHSNKLDTNVRQQLASGLGLSQGNRSLQRTLFNTIQRQELPIELQKSVDPQSLSDFELAGRLQLVDQTFAKFTEFNEDSHLLLQEQKNLKREQNRRFKAPQASTAKQRPAAGSVEPAIGTSFSISMPDSTVYLPVTSINLGRFTLLIRPSFKATGSFEAKSKAAASSPTLVTDISTQKQELEQEISDKYRNVGLTLGSEGIELSFMDQRFPLKVSAEGNKIHFSSTPQKATFETDRWILKGSAGFKMTWDLSVNSNFDEDLLPILTRGIAEVAEAAAITAIIIGLGITATKLAAAVAETIATIVVNLGSALTMPIIIFVPSETGFPGGINNGSGPIA